MNPSFQAIFLHGWATNHHIFDELVKLLPYKIWAPDLPGHGINSLNNQFDIENIITQLNNKIQQPIHLMGWSLGGMIALAYTSKYPQKVRSLTLCATMAKYLATDDYRIGMDKNYLANLLTQFEQDYNQTIEKFLLLQTLSNPQCQTIAQTLIAKQTQYGTPTALHSVLDFIVQFDARLILNKINLPCLLIYGKRDKITPISMGQYLQQNIKHADLKLYEKSAHLPFVTEMPQFINNLTFFWNKVND